MNIESITIKDIAKALDLSYSTVSRALKGSHKISAETQQKVKAYAAKHHYRPNLIAQSLKNKKSRCIGVVLCSIPNSFFAEVISGIESVAHIKDYLVIVTQNLESHEREVQNLEQLTWRSVDGLLVSLATETEDIGHFTKLHEQGLPIVFFDRVTDGINTHRVVSDNAGGAYQATRHLIEQGYTKIAQVTSTAHMSITKERLEGYTKALAEAGLPVNDNYIKYCPHGGMMTEEIETAIQELLSLPEPPDALFGASDRITLGCFSILEKRGLHIPTDMALTGFSNFGNPELFNPSLTTIKQAAFEMGKTATELLVELIESKRPVTSFEKKVLPTELMIRNSTGKIFH
jgi:DNA-binding LacI/PurR family transcriptional regulator